MSLVKEIVSKVSTLPVEKQQEVLDFVEFVASRQTSRNGEADNDKKPPFRSVMGILAHTGRTVTEEDIAEVRREMWQNFPREEPR